MPARIPGNAREGTGGLPRAPWRRAEAGPAGGGGLQVAASLARPPSLFCEMRGDQAESALAGEPRPLPAGACLAAKRGAQVSRLAHPSLEADEGAG